MSNDPSSGTKPPEGFMSWATQYFQETVTKVKTTVDNYTSARSTYLVDVIPAEARVNGLRGKPGIDIRFNEIDAQLVAAKAAEAASDYIKANTHLAQVMSLHPDADQQSADFTSNQSTTPTVSSRVSTLKNHPGKRAIPVWFGEIETKFKEAEAATLAHDHTLAKSKLDECWKLHRSNGKDLALELANACEWYDVNLAAVENRLAGLNTRVGHKSIVLEREAVETKLNEAKAKASSLEFLDAKSLLLAAYNLHRPAAEDIATKCETYFTERTNWNGFVTNLKNRPQGPVVAEETTKLEEDVLGIVPRAEARQWKVLDAMLRTMGTRWIEADAIRKKCVAYNDDLVIKEACVTALANHVSTHKRADAITAQIDLLNGSLTKAKAHADIAKREYDDAIQVMVDIPQQCDAAKLIADACEKYENKLVTANEKFKAAKLLPGIEKEIEALNGTLQRAAALATNASGKFLQAEQLLDEAILGCAAATTLSGQLAGFETATGEALKLGTIAEAGTELKKQVAAVRALLPQIVGLPAHDKIQQQLGEIDKLIDSVPLDSSEKPDVAFKSASEKCNAANLAIRRMIDLGYATARTEALAKIQPLESRCKDTPLAAKLAEIKTVTLAASDLKAKSEEYAAAMELLAKVAAECKALTLVADAMDKYKADRPGLDTKVTDLESKRAALGTEIDELTALLAQAKAQADLGEYLVAVTKCEEVTKGLTLTTKLGDVKSKIATPPTNDTEFEALKMSCINLMSQPGGSAKVDAIVAALPAKVQRYVMMALMMARFDLKEFKQFKSDKIWQCHWDTCDGRNYESDSNCRKCNKTRKYWTCGHSPCKHKNQWTVPCAACGGDFSGSTSGDAKVASSYDTANLQGDDYTKGAKSIKRLFEVFAMVPESQTRENDKLKKIIRYKDNTGGAAYGGDTIYMHCGRAGDDGSLDYAEQLLPGSQLNKGYFPAPDPSAPEGDARRDVYQMDPKCQPKPGSVDPGKKKPYFDFATLHEIGHAVDDKRQVMARNGSKDEYGGWINFGSDVTKIAKIASEHFKFDQAYIEERLLGNTPPLPALPTVEPIPTPENWAALKLKVDDWCDGIKLNKNLWWDGANSARLSIDGRVYQQAYESTWISYKLSARNKGIHGYQFRAPGEWFAELYAAYHSKILHDDHPSASWLSKL